MTAHRTYLKPGTHVTLSCGNTYEITGAPIGTGGGSIIYPVDKIFIHNGEIIRDGICYALKECYPVSQAHMFVRNEKMEIFPENQDSSGTYYLNRVKEMQLDEKRITQAIYRTGSRLLPILESGNTAAIHYFENTSDSSAVKENCFEVENTYTVMESLSSKGKSLHAYIEEYGTLTLLQTFHIIKQLLFSLREIHNAGFLHLDIQDGNVFLKGTLEDESDIVTLIDFGSARELIQGKTDVIADKVIFTTHGFTAPEIILHNDGTLQLGPEADIYSVGCLILYLLTGNFFYTNHLIHNTSGKYLPKSKLRKIDCPKHLLNRMQEIIAHALAEDPKDRYHSANNMLEDVSDFLKALQPYRSDLASVSYDAFICYKHGEIDSAVARILQKKLEHFHVPHKISQKGVPFKKIFMDEGELSSCSDFGEQVRSALKNSGWLIVICSPDTPLSPWVNLEIDTFLKYHDHSRILSIITDGEPKSSFPSQLLGEHEVLAADVRGNSLNEILKKIKGDALLKIAAPMLGITYDSLKQRRRIYHYKRIAGFAAMFTIISLVFSVFAYKQAVTISRQADEISAEYNRTLISQSQYYVKEAKELIDHNNIIGAVNKLLMALPDETTDRPVLSEAVYALTDALNIYKSDYAAVNTATPVNYLSFTDEMESNFYFDQSGKYLFTSNRYTIWVLDSDTFESVQTITLPDNGFIMDFKNDFFINDQEQIIFYDAGNYSIHCINYLSGKEIWVNSSLIDETAADSGVSLALSDDYSLLAVAISDKVYTIDSETGTVIDNYEYSVQGLPDIMYNGEYQEPEMGNTIVFSPDNRYLAYTTYQWEDIDGYYYYPYFIYIIDLKEHTTTTLAESIDSVHKMRFSGTHLLIMANTVQNVFIGHVSYEQNHNYVGDTTIYSYNLSTKNIDWHSSVECYGRSYYEDIRVIDSPYASVEGEIVIAAYGNTIVTLSYKDGQIIQNCQYPYPIVDLDTSNLKEMCAVHSNGYFSWRRYINDSNTQKDIITYQDFFINGIGQVQRIDDYFYTLAFSDNANTLFLYPDSIIKYQLEKASSTYQTSLTFNCESDIPPSLHPLEDDWEYLIDNNTLKLINYKHASTYAFELPLSNDDTFDEYNIIPLGVSLDEKKLYVYYKTWSPVDSPSIIYAFDIETGLSTSHLFSLNENDILEDVIYNSGKIYFLTLTGTTTNYADEVLPGKDGKGNDISGYDVTSYNKLNIYEWCLESDALNLLSEIKLEETSDKFIYFISYDCTKDYGKVHAKTAIESYISDSFSISEDGNILSLGIQKRHYSVDGNDVEKSARFVNLNIQTGKAITILPVAMENNEILDTDFHITNQSGTINAIVYNWYEYSSESSKQFRTLFVFDSDGKTVLEETFTDEEIENIFFSKDESELMVFFSNSDKNELVVYSLETGAISESINLSEYDDTSLDTLLHTFSDCYISWIDDTTFLVYNGSDGLIIDKNCSPMGITAYIKDCIGYDETDQSIYVVHTEYSSDGDIYEWGKFSYLSLDNIIQLGQELIK